VHEGSITQRVREQFAPLVAELGSLDEIYAHAAHIRDTVRHFADK